MSMGSAERPAGGPGDADGSRTWSESERGLERRTDVEDAGVVWLLDVDGVINALGFDDHLTVIEANGFMIGFDPAVWRRALALHTEGLIEIRWLTTWGRRANQHISPALGWPELAVIERPYSNRTGLRWWKLPLAQAVHAQGKPIVWTDDDLAHDREALRWCAQNSETVLGVSPDLEIGLTMEHLDAIEKWAMQR